MKKLDLFYFITVPILIILLSSCDKNFLDRMPLDSVVSESFFNNPNDLKTYINQFYTEAIFPTSMQYGSDLDSDNSIGGIPSVWLEGSRTLDDAANISFEDVRKINYFFMNYRKVEENYDLSDYQQYLGEAYFFKAVIYFNLLSKYGNIQWYDSTLTTESVELFNKRDDRNIIADNIISLLDSAKLYLSSEKTDGASRVNRWMALLIQSRVALFEGTWEKYHSDTEFGVLNATPDKYFEKAADAASEVMNSGLYKIYSEGAPSYDYHHLFILRDYSSNEEVMFWKKYDNGLGKGEVPFRNEINFREQYPSDHSVTKGLADSYLCIDGSPISSSTLFRGYSSITQEMENRDPRFSQTVAHPDTLWHEYENGDKDYYKLLYENLNTTTDYRSPAGYVIRKRHNANTLYNVPQYEETPRIIYRYAEVLLNYAEAKAELGTITQEDINQSIKKMRDRVGMPNIELSNVVNDSDNPYVDISPVIYEVRRERRVELALDGFRASDLRRWAAADELIKGKRPKGFKASQVADQPYPIDQNGFLDPFQKRMPNGYGFKTDRDYLDPIPKTQRVLNPDIEQNPGWEN